VTQAVNCFRGFIRVVVCCGRGRGRDYGRSFTYAQQHVRWQKEVSNPNL